METKRFQIEIQMKPVIEPILYIGSCPNTYYFTHTLTIGSPVDHTHHQINHTHLGLRSSPTLRP